MVPLRFFCFCVLLLTLCWERLEAQTRPGAAAAKSASGPAGKTAAPAKARPTWKVTDYRGQAYVDLADVALFFDFPIYKKNGRTVYMEKTKMVEGREFKIHCSGQVGSKLIAINTLKFYLSYPIVSWRDGRLLLSVFDLNHVIDPIMRPDQQREPTQLKVVVLDPARGGAESGVTSRFGKEKDITLNVAHLARQRLEKLGYQVVMTRAEDTAVSITERLKRANAQAEEAVFISLHCSYGNAKESGIEMFTLSPSGTPSTTGDEGKEPDKKFYPGNINDRESMALATALHGSLVGGPSAAIKTEDRGIRRARFEELKGIRMPGVLCSLGRLAHPVEGKHLADAAYHQRLADALSAGVDRYARVMAAGSPPRDRALKFGKIQTTAPTALGPAGGQIVHVRAAIAKTDPAKEIDPSLVTLQIYFLDFVNDEEIDLSSCDTPQTTWVSVIPDWKKAVYEEVDFTYAQPPFDSSLAAELGRRTYCGFVLRLIYNDELMDEYSEPANLRRGLNNFTAVLPRRR